MEPGKINFKPPLPPSEPKVLLNETAPPKYQECIDFLNSNNYPYDVSRHIKQLLLLDERGVTEWVDKACFRSSRFGEESFNINRKITELNNTIDKAQETIAWSNSKLTNLFNHNHVIKSKLIDLEKDLYKVLEELKATLQITLDIIPEIEEIKLKIYKRSIAVTVVNSVVFKDNTTWESRRTRLVSIVTLLDITKSSFENKIALLNQMIETVTNIVKVTIPAKLVI